MSVDTTWDVACDDAHFRYKTVTDKFTVIRYLIPYIANESGQDCKDHWPTWQAASEAHGVIVNVILTLCTLTRYSRILAAGDPDLSRQGKSEGTRH